MPPSPAMLSSSSLDPNASRKNPPSFGFQHSLNGADFFTSFHDWTISSARS
eukprot:CAMPEP_0183737992 /NCGR_PEP_ID=MMETSP0737-20130205/53595_1 /TAXON_ID=385413 /ORGANISM="Thalassiosira miniscula, Strain CCMP1093" /LENGTH=50 /DNA_ID=CAMNT_0025972431 /DNA_START=37 /DNA_END=185 /DNA_ORIENTATION=-